MHVSSNGYNLEHIVGLKIKVQFHVFVEYWKPPVSSMRKRSGNIVRNISRRTILENYYHLLAQILQRDLIKRT